MTMMSDDILALLDDLESRRSPVDDRERASIERIRSDLAHLSDPCSEDADTTHVTASALIVGPSGLVLHRHKRLGIWLQPGGHIDPGEHPAAAAVREAREETGLDVQHHGETPLLVHVDAHNGPKGHFHLDLRYLLCVDPVLDPRPAPPEGESQDVAWFSWHSLQSLTDTETDTGSLRSFLRALTAVRTRPAQQGDTAAITSCYLRSFEWAYRDTPVRLAHSHDDVRGWVATNLLPEHTVRLADAGGAVVGFAAHSPGRLDQLYIDPAWTGLGVGTRLLDEVRSAQPDGFDLWTFETNTRARRFYERHGFTVVEHSDGSGNEERQPDVRMSNAAARR